MLDSYRGTEYLHPRALAGTIGTEAYPLKSRMTVRLKAGGCAFLRRSHGWAMQQFGRWLTWLTEKVQ